MPENKTVSTESVSDKPTAQLEQSVSREAYAAFIGQIGLSEIWLQEARVTNTHGPQTPEKATFRFESKAHWTDRDGGFRVAHQYTVNIEANEAIIAKIEVTFGLDFRSAQPITKEIFDIFEDVNLSVNTWPFLREFVSTTVGRMGWSPFTLPALKKGTSPKSRPPKKATATPRRSRASTNQSVSK